MFLLFIACMSVPSPDKRILGSLQTMGMSDDYGKVEGKTSLLWPLICGTDAIGKAAGVICGWNKKIRTKPADVVQTHVQSTNAQLLCNQIVFLGIYRAACCVSCKHTHTHTHTCARMHARRGKYAKKHHCVQCAVNVKASKLIRFSLLHF